MTMIAYVALMALMTKIDVKCKRQFPLRPFQENRPTQCNPFATNLQKMMVKHVEH